jgi:putative transposase
MNQIGDTMADELRMGLARLLRKARMEHNADFLKEGVRVLSQALMEMEIEGHIGAGRHERVAGRSGHRNGYRERSWDTRVGSVELKVPRVRDGSYFPSLLEPRRRAERALSAVVQRPSAPSSLNQMLRVLANNGVEWQTVSRLVSRNSPS